MAKQIMVTSTQLRNRADELDQLIAQYSTRVDSLVTGEQKLNTSWDGEANDVFHGEFLKNKGYLDKFHEVVKRYIEALRQAANTYDRAESQAAGIAKTS